MVGARYHSNMFCLLLFFAVSKGALLPSGSYLPSLEDDDIRLGPPRPPKNVFFFAAPDEEQAQVLPIRLASSAGGKDNVIFIKAPTYKSPVPEVQSAFSEGEGKTLVYVLVKRSEGLDPVHIPALGSIPTKPEVYLVKYGSKEEAGRVIAAGLKGEAVGAAVQELNDAQSFSQILGGGSNR